MREEEIKNLEKHESEIKKIIESYKSDIRSNTTPQLWFKILGSLTKNRFKIKMLR